jgi:type II secretory pathway pseudopilin PulG
MHHQQESGDTIIEVLFAVTVFAMVAVGSMAIMNQGMATAERSLEITLVRQQMDAQAEAIRYIHQAFVASFQNNGSAPTGVAAEWVKMTDKITGRGADGASAFGQTPGDKCPATVPGQHPFVLDARTASVSNVQPVMVAPSGASLPPFPQVIYNSDSSINQAYGIWVEAVPSTASNGPGFVDFHIRSCWDGPGSAAPITLGTIVRLYEPN